MVFYNFVNILQRSLVTEWLLSALIFVFVQVILLVVFAHFINGVVCQMREQVREITFFCTLILVCGEPSKTIVKEINSKRVDTEQ